MEKNECLILGPEGVGKTLLLKKLKVQISSNKKNSTPASEPESSSMPTDNMTAGLIHTVPTAGTNIEKIKLSNGVSCTLRECGESIAPLWSSYFSDCSMVLYVVDVTNSSQISAATMLLLDILTAKDLENKPVMVFFNKCDCELKMSLIELKSIMRLDDLTENSALSLTVLQGSCVTENGLSALSNWIVQNIR